MSNVSFLSIAEKNFTEVVELLHVPLQTLYNFQSTSKVNTNNIENGHVENFNSIN